MSHVSTQQTLSTSGRQQPNNRVRLRFGGTAPDQVQVSVGPTARRLYGAPE
jgi:hypothetical protein